MEEAGVDVPLRESRVEVDLCGGAVVRDVSELSEDLSVLKLALERRLRSLKKGIVASCVWCRARLRSANGT